MTGIASPHGFVATLGTELRGAVPPYNEAITSSSEHPCEVVDFTFVGERNEQTRQLAGMVRSLLGVVGPLAPLLERTMNVPALHEGLVKILVTNASLTHTVGTIVTRARELGLSHELRAALADLDTALEHTIAVARSETVCGICAVLPQWQQAELGLHNLLEAPEVA